MSLFFSWFAGQAGSVDNRYYASGRLGEACRWQWITFEASRRTASRVHISGVRSSQDVLGWLMATVEDERVRVSMSEAPNTKRRSESSRDEEEALERYYRRRIQEIRRGERPPGGASWTLDEVKRIAGEQPSPGDRRSG